MNPIKRNNKGQFANGNHGRQRGTKNFNEKKIFASEWLGYFVSIIKDLIMMSYCPNCMCDNCLNARGLTDEYIKRRLIAEGLEPKIDVIAQEKLRMLINSTINEKQRKIKSSRNNGRAV